MKVIMFPSSCASTLFLLSLLFLLFCSAPFPNTPAVVEAWTNNRADRVNGICAWSKYAPNCPVPMNCRVALPPSIQFSPINFGLVLNGFLTAPNMCLSREQPMVKRRATEEDVLDELPTMRLDRNGGGVLTARCSTTGPIMAHMTRCNNEQSSSSSDEDDDDTQQPPPPVDDPFPDDVMLELMEVQFYNGLLHQWTSTSLDYAKAGDTEVEMFFRKQTAVEVDPVTGESTFVSECLAYTVSRAPPDVIISFSLRPSETVASVNASVMMRILDAITFSASELETGSGRVVTLPEDLPLLPYEMHQRNRVRGYVGSMVHPPCTRHIPRIILTTPIPVPLEAIEGIAKASANTPNVYDGMVHMANLNTKFYDSSLAQVPSLGSESDSSDDDSTGSKSDEASGLHIAVVILIIVNCVLAFYLVILIFARWEWVSVPTGLGGLNHEVQFYTPSYKAVEEMTAKGLWHANGGDDTSDSNSNNNNNNNNNNHNYNNSNSNSYSDDEMMEIESGVIPLMNLTPNIMVSEGKRL